MLSNHSKQLHHITGCFIINNILFITAAQKTTYEYLPVIITALFLFYVAYCGTCSLKLILFTQHFPTQFNPFAGKICHHFWLSLHTSLIHCLTFVYSFEALCTDGKVCGKPQGQYRSTADYRGGQHES